MLATANKQRSVVKRGNQANQERRVIAGQRPGHAVDTGAGRPRRGRGAVDNRARQQRAVPAIVPATTSALKGSTLASSAPSATALNIRQPVVRNVLAMPHFAPTVPARIQVTAEREDHTRTSVRFVEELMALGALGDNDWQGTLAATMQYGFRKWLDGLGVENLKILQLDFIYADNLERIGAAEHDWREHFDHYDPNPLGVLSLHARGTRYVEVGERVKFFESLRPGCGYNLLALACRVLFGTTGAVTPAWSLGNAKSDAYEITILKFQAAVGRGEFSDPEARAAAEAELVTEANFLRNVPIEACATRYDPHPVRKAFRKLPESAEWDLGTLDAAAELHALWKRYEDVCGGGDHFDILGFGSGIVRQTGAGPVILPNRKIAPVGIRWSNHDLIRRIGDDFHETLRHAGLGVLHVFNQAFDAYAPARTRVSLTTAFANMTKTIQLVVLADRVIQGLVSDRPPASDQLPVLADFVNVETIRRALQELQAAQVHATQEQGAQEQDRVRLRARA